MSKKILVVSQYFYPERFRINDICETWVEKGYDVTVLTGIPNYPEGDFFKGYNLFKKRKENYKGIKIIRIPIFPRKKNNIFLALNYLSFVISGSIWQLFHKENYDSIFIYEVSPMTQALPAVFLGKRKKIPVSIYVMDLWPENFSIVTGINNKRIIKLLNQMVDYIYKNCNYIFTSSNSFKENIENRGHNEQKVIFWPQYAEDFYYPSNEKNATIPQDGKTNITFAGNIGTAQGLEIVPELLNEIKEEKLNIRLNFVGNGRYKEILVNQIEELGLNEWVTFIEPVSPENIPQIMSASDFSLIMLQKSEIYQMTIPAKVQSSMACGIPIILSAEGEVQEIIKEADAGFYSQAGDIKGLLESIKQASQLSQKEIIQKGNNARLFFEENYKKSKLMNDIDQYL